MENNINNSHDKFFKSLFSKKEVVTEFVEKFLPKEISNHIELETLTLENTEYVDKELKKYCSDIVYTCKYKNNDEEVEVEIALLLEHKSTPEQYPHLQLLRYLLNAWESQLKQGKKLTPVVPIIFYHGQKKWNKRPLNDYFTQIDSLLERFIPNFDYALIDTSDYNDNDMEQLRNAALRLGFFSMKYIFTPNMLIDKFPQGFSGVDELFITRQGKDTFDSIAVYLMNHTDLTNEEWEEKMNTVSLQAKQEFISTAERLQMKGIEIGRKEGRQEGKLEGIMEIARNLKKLGADIKMIVKSTGLSEKEIENL